MTTFLSAEKIAEIQNYEAQMSDYFFHYSKKLREWYANGGSQSENYRVQYEKLQEEYNRYLNYVQQFKKFMNRDLVDNQNKDIQNQVADINTISNATNKIDVGSKSAVAANYTRYYQEMINYFGKILETVQQNDNGSESSDEELLPVSNEIQTTSSRLVHNQSIQQATAISNNCVDPDVVMKDYFTRYVETGQWDWASWNNYLSWIARTNPQWHNLFLQLSMENGIDWTEMYNKWKKSLPIGVEQLSANYLTTQNCSANPVILTNQISRNVRKRAGVLPDVSDEEVDWKYCSTCEQNFGTERAFFIHLRGVKHTQLVLRESCSVIVESQPITEEESWEEKHFQWVKSQYANYDNSALELSGTFYCELCDIEFPSYKVLASHLVGRRHRENVIIFENTGDRSQLKSKRPRSAKLSAKIQPLLDVCTQPIIGLQYLVEYQLGNSLEECMYLCDLCGQWLSRVLVVKHFCSFQHRKAYLNAYYLDLFKIVEKDESVVDIATRRVEVYARKIEDFEGRKRLIVKQQDIRNLKPLDIPARKPSKTKQKPNLKHPVKSNPSHSDEIVSADLEEGEVMDESSSDEGETESVDALFFARYAHIIEFIEKQSDWSGRLRTGTVESHFVDTQETCDEYIDYLKSGGYLNLKQSKKDAKSSHRSKRADSHDEQFSVEVGRILEKLELIQAQVRRNEQLSAAGMAANARIQASLTSQSTSSRNGETIASQDVDNAAVQHHWPVEQQKHLISLKKPPAPAKPIPSTAVQSVFVHPQPIPTTVSAQVKPNGFLSLSTNAFDAILSAIATLNSKKPPLLCDPVPNNAIINNNITNSSSDVNVTKLPSSHGVVNNSAPNVPKIIKPIVQSTSLLGDRPITSTPVNETPIANTILHECGLNSLKAQIDKVLQQNLLGDALANVIHKISASSVLPVPERKNSTRSDNHQQQLVAPEPIYDAYSIVSRRSEQRKQSRLQKMSQQPDRVAKTTEPKSRNRSQVDEWQHQLGSGRKLSAIADFLGVNSQPSGLHRPTSGLPSRTTKSTASVPTGPV